MGEGVVVEVEVLNAGPSVTWELMLDFDDPGFKIESDFDKDPELAGTTSLSLAGCDEAEPGPETTSFGTAGFGMTSFETTCCALEDEIGALAAELDFGAIETGPDSRVDAAGFSSTELMDSFAAITGEERPRSVFPFSVDGSCTMLEGDILAGVSVTVSLTAAEGTSFAFGAARKPVGVSSSLLSTILALIRRRGATLRMRAAIGIAATPVGSACGMKSRTNDATTGAMFSVVRGELTVQLGADDAITGPMFSVVQGDLTVQLGADVTCSMAGVYLCCPNA